MDEAMKIIRINAFIQRKMGKLYLDGKEVEVVSLDRSYVAGQELVNEPLNDAQLDDLFGQTYGKPPATQAPETPAEQLAELFHTTYERLAPSFGYETREATSIPWEQIPADNPNKRLMIAVAGEILEHWQHETSTHE